MAHRFPPGTKVQTNAGYFNRFGRKVIGETVAFKGNTPPYEISLVRWTYQEGSTIPDHQGQVVAMRTVDLEKSFDPILH